VSQNLPSILHPSLIPAATQHYLARPLLCQGCDGRLTGCHWYVLSLDLSECSAHPSPNTGGLGFAFSAYLNGRFLGSNSSILTASATATFDFPAGMLSNTTENVLVVVQDHQGLDQGNCGLLSLSLLLSRRQTDTKYMFCSQLQRTSAASPRLSSREERLPPSLIGGLYKARSVAKPSSGIAFAG
jgi:hypothetical protein